MGIIRSIRTRKGTHRSMCLRTLRSPALGPDIQISGSNFIFHNITSASRCCTISKDAKVKVRLDCPRGRHHDEIEILTAKACRCDMCRKSRY
ncbi:glycoprotein hormone alpha-2 [Lates japonicus]|uniref:Glycoprotein hormone alpha-2 n=1 Tax=Lates japonicus TaxID=270547 RepID=A0AAD3MGV6_LATJO|nr:glycoprotein hormone alpha-2 [Lates japonicus]